MVTSNQHALPVYFCDPFEIPFPPGHRFPQDKYRLTREILEKSDWYKPKNLQIPPPVTEEQILRVHTTNYLTKIRDGKLSIKEQKRLGFPWSVELFERSRRSVGGTIQASLASLDVGIAVNLAGGTHHAFIDHGEGFCMMNDVAIAVHNIFALQPDINRILIVDCDVHQGNGTAAIFNTDERVFTYSIHAEKNFPFRKFPSDLDVSLPDGCDDLTYLGKLKESVGTVIDTFHPEMVFFLAGADPYQDDLLGRMAISKSGLALRDSWVIRRIRQLEIPITIVLAGGYAREIIDTAEIHTQTIRIAQEQYTHNDNQ